MTVYTPLDQEAGGAAKLANALLKGQKTPNGMVNKSIPNGSVSVPSVFLASEIVTQKSINQTVIAGKFWKASDICTEAFKTACAKYGIK